MDHQNHIGADKRRVAATLALTLGALGVHKFYLGYPIAGFVMLLASTLGLLLVFPAVLSICIGVYEGIKYLRCTDFNFTETYIYESKAWL